MRRIAQYTKLIKYEFLMHNCWEMENFNIRKYNTRIGELNFYEFFDINELVVLVIKALIKSEKDCMNLVNQLKTSGLKFTKSRIGRLGEGSEVTIEENEEKIKYGFYYEVEDDRFNNVKIPYMKYFLETDDNADRFKRMILYFECFRKGRTHAWEISGAIFYSPRLAKFIFPAEEYED